jgi:hypothetical protein
VSFEPVTPHTQPSKWKKVLVSSAWTILIDT